MTASCMDVVHMLSSPIVYMQVIVAQLVTLKITASRVLCNPAK